MSAPMLNTKSAGVTTPEIVRWLVKTVTGVLIFGTCLLLAAGRWDWAPAWQYLGLLFLIQLLNAVVLIPLRPDLIAERSKVQEGTKSWDRYLSAGMALVGPLLIVITAGLDARFGWSASFSAPVRLFGAALILSGGLFGLWAMAANRFFSGTVRIQKERGHVVADSGPYRLVRHPGYLAAILYDLGIPLVLMSGWAFIPAGLTILVIFVRTTLEDRTLQAELPGYTAYARRVRSRLIPGIW